MANPVCNREALLDAFSDAGLAALLENANGATLQVYESGSRRIPLIVCDDSRSRASFLSPTGHYLRYPLHELRQQLDRVRYWGLALALMPVGLFFWIGRIGRVVYVNHWVTVGGAPLALDAGERSAMIDRLIERYPTHAIVFSSMTAVEQPECIEALVAGGALAVPSRKIWLYDPARPLPGKRYKNRRERIAREKHLRERSELKRLDGGKALKPHLGSMLRLYRALYIDKHSALNPHYTEAYFRLLLANHEIRSFGWLDDDGELRAFGLQQIRDGRIVWTVHGFEQSMGRSHALNRLVFAEDLHVTSDSMTSINWGGGADEFKRARGAIALQEYDIVIGDHLPAFRRLPWRFLHRFRRRRAPDQPCAEG